MLKKILCIMLSLTLLFSILPAGAAAADFADIPAGSWAQESISKAVNLGIISGVGDGLFGYGTSVTRAQFAAMLVRLFGWKSAASANPAFQDNTDKTKWYYAEVETAAANGALPKDKLFRPNDAIKRGEMAEMLVRALGFSGISADAEKWTNPFTDVTENRGFITMAYDFGIIGGVSETAFQPGGSATREQAAAMMVRLYEKYAKKIDWLHAFYALSSFQQKDVIGEADAVSFGWSRLQYTADGGVFLNTTSSDKNEYSIPDGYETVTALAKENQTDANLNVIMSTAQKVTLPDGTASNVCKEILGSAENRKEAVSQIEAVLSKDDTFTGVTVDFEGMKGDALKQGFNAFLQELRGATDKLGRKVFVCVHPATADGIYFDSYDYKTIGKYADKVILMAHDYAALTLSPALMQAGFTATPVTPASSVYYALRAITDPNTGVGDTGKVALAISIGSAGWSLKNGKVVNIAAMQPGPETIYKRLIQAGTTLNFSEKALDPYITYHDDSDNSENIVWYEDERSVEAKIHLARMFGVTSISVWRMGIIPAYQDTANRDLHYDVLSVLINEKAPR